MNDNMDQNTLNNELIITKPFHVPSESQEKMRIYNNNGEVRGGTYLSKKNREQFGKKIVENKPDFRTGGFSHIDRPRVYRRGRMIPGTQVSRSFGDYLAHQIGVSSEPKVGKFTIGRQNEFLVIASSALWNVMTPKEVFQFVRQRCPKGIGLVTQGLSLRVKESYF
jgi:hypothetical protein